MGLGKPQWVPPPPPPPPPFCEVLRCFGVPPPHRGCPHPPDLGGCGDAMGMLPPSRTRTSHLEAVGVPNTPFFLPHPQPQPWGVWGGGPQYLFAFFWEGGLSGPYSRGLGCSTPWLYLGGGVLASLCVCLGGGRMRCGFFGGGGWDLCVYLGGGQSLMCVLGPPHMYQDNPPIPVPRCPCLGGADG